MHICIQQVPVIECVPLIKSGVDEADHFTDQVAEIEAELQAGGLIKKSAILVFELHYKPSKGITR